MYNDFIKKTLFQTMRDVTRETTKNYATDVAIDVECIMSMMYIDKMAWACRESGTHLIFNNDKMKLDTVDAVVRNFAGVRWFLVDMQAETIKEVTTAEEVKEFLK